MRIVSFGFQAGGWKTSQALSASEREVVLAAAHPASEAVERVVDSREGALRGPHAVPLGRNDHGLAAQQLITERHALPTPAVTARRGGHTSVGPSASGGPATDLPRPDRLGRAGHTFGFSVPAPLRNRLLAVAEQAGTSEFMLYHAAVLALLHKLGGGTDLALGTAVAGRGRVLAVTGSPAVVPALRTDVSGNPSLRAVLGRARATSLARCATLGSAADPASGADRFAALLCCDEHGVPSVGDELTDAAPTPELDGARCDLAFTFTCSRDGGCAASITLNADLYRRETPQLFAHRMLRVLHAFADTPDLALADLDVMPAEERRRVLDEWSCGVEVSEVSTAADLLRRARTYPSTRIAWRCGTDAVDFGAVCARLCARPLTSTDGPAGGSLDARSADSRLARTRTELSCAMAHNNIQLGDLLALAGEFVAAAADGVSLEIVDAAGKVLSFEADAVAAAVADRRAVAASRQAGRMDPACRTADRRVIGAGAGTVALLVEALAALADGATLDVVPGELAPAISAHTTHVVADAADLLADLPVLAVDGSPQRWDLLGRNPSRVPALAGVTGTIGYVVPGYAGAVARGPLDGTGRVRPVPGARIFVLDDAGKPTPPGVVGEVFVGGVALARTSSDSDRADGLLRTGDRAHWTTAGWLKLA